MDYLKKERIVNRILSGQIRLFDGKTTYIVKNVSPQTRYEASELYFEALELASFHEIMDNDELKIYLLKNKLWDEQKEKRLEELPKMIEDCKVGIYESILKSKDRAKYRDQLKENQLEYERLFNELHTFDYMSRTGYADYIRSKFIIFKSVDIGNCLNIDVKLEYLLNLINNARISEKQYREIARTEPWRTYWNLSKNHYIWSYGLSEYSDEQKSLCSWSKLYDGIYESTECPHDSVLEDDDMLDGWLISNRRKRDKELLQKQGEEMISKNQRIRNAGEVFVMCQTKEDADRVDSLNDSYARTIKQQRLLALKEQGNIKEQDLPDVKTELVMQANRAMNSKIKGG